jgi:DNA-binding transcriptional LysR family regulator
MDVDLRKIRYFVAVADNLHFRKAAEELHIAQPALSRSIGALERELGTQLFVRDKRSVILTPAGRQLLDDAGPLLAAADATRRRVQRAGRGAHHLVVGFRAGILVTPAVRALSAERPEVTVEVQRLEWDDQEEHILSGRVDVAYVRQPIRERGLRLVPLFAERRLAALPADHPLAQRAGLSTADLAGERHLRYLQPAPVPASRVPSAHCAASRKSSSTSRRDTASSCFPYRPRSTTPDRTSYTSPSLTQSSTRSTSPPRPHAAPS